MTLAPALLVQRRIGGGPRLVSHRPLALVIDDSDDTREVYTVVLRLEGFTVEGARDGREALQKAVELLPDIIITDLAMPIIDGWETIRRLRADDRTRRIPIIACSGEEAPSDAHDTRADALLTKPCPLDTLLLEVRQLLRRGAAA
jgi:CheY-like chemotaxis protein